MTIDEVRARLTALIEEVDGQNMLYHDLAGDIIRSWRDTGGKGAPIHEHLMFLWTKYENDVKLDVLEYAMERMTGWCSPLVAIRFDDFDATTNSWAHDHMSQ